jgi:HK97 family phage portal protein
MRFPWQKRQIKNNPAHLVINRTNYEPVKWTDKNYADLSKAGYENCMTAFACTKLIADTSAALEFQLTDRASGEEIEQHPLLDMLNNPSKYESKRTLIVKLVSYLLLNGNAYPLQVPVLGEPRNLYSLRPDRVTILKGSGYDLVGGYRYEIDGENQDFKRDEVGHLRLFHPTNDYYGYGMIAAAARGVDIANLSDEWNATLFTNQMRPSGMLSLKFNTTKEQKDYLKNAWHEEYEGSRNVGKTVVVEGDAEYTQLSMNQKEMDWLGGDKINSGKICSVFGIAPELIGAGTEKKYSNYGEARRALYTEVVLPMMAFITDELGRWLMPMFGLKNAILKVDTEQIEALQEDRQAKFTYLQNAWWLTPNERRRACGYDDLGPEADTLLVPMGLLPLEQAIAEPEPVPDALQGPRGDDQAEDEKTPKDKEDDAKARKLKARKAQPWDTRERKAVLWKSFEIRVKSREKSFENIAKGYLEKQAAEIKRKVAVANSIDSLSADDILDVEVEAKRYVKTFWPWYMDHFRRAGNAGVQATKGDIFDDAEFKADKSTSWVFDMTDEQEAALRKMVFESGTKVNRTALEKIYQSLKEAQYGNMTVNEFAQALHDHVSSLTDWKAMLWSRTESAKVDNYGQLEGYKTIEFVDKKGWMCSFVPDSRDGHIEADGQERKLDDDFSIDGQPMAYPGDPRGGPGNCCNCLCSTYPVVGEL